MLKSTHESRHITLPRASMTLTSSATYHTASPTFRLVSIAYVRYTFSYCGIL